MKCAAVASLVLVVLLCTGTALAQGPGNECTTVVLHANSGIGDCETGVDCSTVPPTVRIDDPSGYYTVVMYIKNYDVVNGVQVAFDWPATWSFGFGVWRCQSDQLNANTPTAPGPLSGSITTAFNHISGGALAPIGFMVFFFFGASGCLSIIESGYPFGNHVFYDNAVTPLFDDNEGRICVGSEGWNTCECRGATPVESATWGQIKATY